MALTAVVGVGLVALTVLVFVNRESDGQSMGALEQMSGPDPGMGRVYTLGVEPGTDTLYAGTRYGLFRVSTNGQAKRVANRHQETHAIAVLGPGHLLASGHPDPRDDLPEKLGLIESTDGGATWRLVSLGGLADFHVLGATEDLVYGYNSSTQRLLASSDREQWDQRAKLPLSDFAVNPSREAELLAVTDNQTLQHSTNGGRTFTSVSSVPEVAALTWPVPGTVFGIGPDGRVYLSTDSGATWSERGRVDGLPQAVVATTSAQLFVATDTGIYVSNDGGRSFALRYREG